MDIFTVVDPYCKIKQMDNVYVSCELNSSTYTGDVSNVLTDEKYIKNLLSDLV